MGVEISWLCFGTISVSVSFSILAADAKEKQFWVTQLRACAKYHMETNSKVGNHGEAKRHLIAWTATLQPNYLFLWGSCFSCYFFQVIHCSGIHMRPATFMFRAKKKVVEFTCG